MDYLKLTVWAPVRDVLDVLERGVLDRYGWSIDPFSPQEHWEESIATGRACRIYQSGSIDVIEYLDDVTQESTFCTVEVKGQACEHLGNSGIRLVLDDLGAWFRIRASRVDVMAHTNSFTPRTIRDAVQSGDISSRSVSCENLVYIESAEGDTCYLGMKPKRRGGLKRSGERVLRIYDRRGPSRVELEMLGDYAHGAGDELRNHPIEEWPRLLRGMIRHYCDFVDRTADKRVTRCPLMPWWEEFVEGVEKISVRPAGLLLEGTPIGKVDGIFERYARRLYAAIEAYGGGWVESRIRLHGRKRRDSTHELLVAELERFKGTGLAGVPDRDEAIPI
ncbi:MAG: hypothetical protein H6813_00270 [Phycisphaeraceae bacterium]|nr:hypothetical protein [Phycisphaeraceae bacterium]MCB9847481.1 hypothetical protein [Phycisphaeraceae bacterium]